MVRFYRQRRDRFQSDRELDRRIAAAEQRRVEEQRAFDAMIEDRLAARTPEQVERDDAELAQDRCR